MSGTIVNDGLPTMEAAEALAAHDLVYVSAAGKVSKTTADTDVAIGVVLRDYALGDKHVSVVPGAKGHTLHMRSAGVIAAGDEVVAAADGECQTKGASTGRVLGIALDAAAGADEVIRVATL